MQINIFKLFKKQSTIEKAVDSYNKLISDVDSKIQLLKSEYNEFKSIVATSKEINEIEAINIVKSFSNELESLNNIRKSSFDDFAKNIKNEQNEFAGKYKTKLTDSLGKNREDMPQISENDIDSFLIHFSGNSNNASVKKIKIKLSKLKPSQNELNDDKVIEGLTNNNWKDRNYIVSEDNYLLDGHHSWASGLEIDSEKEVTAYKVSLPARELIRRSNLLKITKTKDIDDNVVKSLLSNFVSRNELTQYLDVNYDTVISSETYNKVASNSPIAKGEIIKGELTNIVLNKSDLIFKSIIVDSDKPFCFNFYTLKKSEIEKSIKQTSGESKKLYADIIVKNNEGKILLLKRSASDNFGAWKYGLPGGNVEENETIGQAVRRELFEETNLEVEKIDFLTKIDNNDNSISHYFFAQKPESDVIAIDSNEHDNYVWVNKEEWNELELIGELKERLNSLFDNNSENLLKSEYGIYSDNYENKKLNRVGQKYSKDSEKKVEEKEKNNQDNSQKLNLYAKKASDKQLQDALESDKLNEIEKEIAEKELNLRESKKDVKENKVNLKEQKKLGRSGKFIQKTATNPAQIYKGVTSYLDSIKQKYDFNFSKTTSSRYVTTEDKNGNVLEIRVANHSPAIDDIDSWKGVEVSSYLGGELNVKIDTSFGYKTEDVKNIFKIVEDSSNKVKSHELKISYDELYGINSDEKNKFIESELTRLKLDDDEYGVNKNIIKDKLYSITFTDKYKEFVKNKIQEEVKKKEKIYFNFDDIEVTDLNSTVADSGIVFSEKYAGSENKKIRKDIKDYLFYEIGNKLKKNEITKDEYIKLAKDFIYSKTDSIQDNKKDFEKKFKVGEKLNHTTYGQVTVISEDENTVTVDAENGLKRLLKKVAPLTKIETDSIKKSIVHNEFGLGVILEETEKTISATFECGEKTILKSIGNYELK